MYSNSFHGYSDLTFLVMGTDIDKRNQYTNYFSAPNKLDHHYPLSHLDPQKLVDPQKYNVTAECR
uniref:Uncharacterized protein n=1 Tax=Nelumbo nucifera TaxID=4432 RepID=A0A822YVY9_NELNU|nr:TPA_asm: hypothetical protein HUJ06_006943 [Nelumbo nucifera]